MSSSISGRLFILYWTHLPLDVSAHLEKLIESFWDNFSRRNRLPFDFAHDLEITRQIKWMMHNPFFWHFVAYLSCFEEENQCFFFQNVSFWFIEDIPKPPSEPAPLAKESQLIEDEVSWRRPTSIRLNRSNQHENPPKIRKYPTSKPITTDQTNRFT